MKNEFKYGERVIVYGIGKKDGKFYKDKPGKVIERDIYYKDYCVKFRDETEDWFEQDYLRKPYKKRKGKKII
ncbi:MAG: hypothetical protein IJH39_00625 [Clostridia bacterium]|nr:hypothetical protein [Clostridia bacterium]